MQESWYLHVLVSIRRGRGYKVLVIPRNYLSVSIDLDHLEIVFHNETKIVVSLAIINIFDIVVNGGIGLVPRHGRICCSYLVKGDERGNGRAVRWIHLHNNGLLITETKHEEHAVIVDFTTRDGRNGKGNVVKEFTPFPVTFKIYCIGESMVIGGRSVVLRCGVSCYDDELIHWVEHCATNFLIF